jgi:hypothetical protein
VAAADQKPTPENGRMKPISIESARHHWQVLFPDPAQRRRVATIMAMTVERANATHPNCWMVSYKPHRPYFNINVGPIFAFSASPGALALLLDATVLPPDLLPEHWEGGKYKSRWKVLPDTTWTHGPTAEVLALWDKLEPSYLSAVDLAIAKGGMPPWWKHHDRIAMQVLREESGRDLPEPAQPENPNAASEPQDSLESLIDEFATTYPSSPEGLRHARDSLDATGFFQEAFASIRERRQAREDVTDAVLTKLLPHARRPGNIERGAWITTAPVYNTDIRKYFEAMGRAQPGDWPQVANLILDLFVTCLNDPRHLAEACETFTREVPVKGIQAGGLSPGLAVLNPDAFTVINAKPLAVVKRFLGRKHSPKLVDYPEACADVLRLAEQAREGLMGIPELEGLTLNMRFDMFTHWLVAVRPSNEVRYWKIAPGEQAFNWEACRRDGFISMGWEKFGDLSVMSREEFDERSGDLAVQDVGYSPGGTPQLWVFANDIHKGDRIIANKGLSQILGVGTVDGEYYFEPGVVHGHRLPVRWDEFAPIDVPRQGWTKTIVSLKSQQFESLVGAVPPPPPPPPATAARNVWMFQANPKLFDLEHALQIDGCDAIDAWKVAVFKDKIQPGDIVLLWQSGKKAGIYAVAEATGPVFEITVDTADEFVEPAGTRCRCASRRSSRLP